VYDGGLWVCVGGVCVWCVWGVCAAEGTVAVGVEAVEACEER